MQVLAPELCDLILVVEDADPGVTQVSCDPRDNVAIFYFCGYALEAATLALLADHVPYAARRVLGGQFNAVSLDHALRV